jgi:hypothetical protein
MDGRMHYMFTRQFFPTLTPVQVKKINSSLDNRRNDWMEFPEYDPLGVAQKGHRRKKHDALSAAFLGARYGGSTGMQAALFHTMLDQVSTNIEQWVGSERRDILFAMWKMSMSRRGMR